MWELLASRASALATVAVADDAVFVVAIAAHAIPLRPRPIPWVAGEVASVAVAETSMLQIMLPT